LTDNAVSIALAKKMWKEGKPVSAICHGPTALVNVKDSSVKHIVLCGRKVARFSNEEKQAGLPKQIPYLVEKSLNEVLICRLLWSTVVRWKVGGE
jgi:putative intracellular protease/amidase